MKAKTSSEALLELTQTSNWFRNAIRTYIFYLLVLLAMVALLVFADELSPADASQAANTPQTVEVSGYRLYLTLTIMTIVTLMFLWLSISSIAGIIRSIRYKLKGKNLTKFYYGGPGSACYTPLKRSSLTLKNTRVIPLESIAQLPPNNTPKRAYYLCNSITVLSCSINGEGLLELRTCGRSLFYKPSPMEPLLQQTICEVFALVGTIHSLFDRCDGTIIEVGLPLAAEEHDAS